MIPANVPCEFTGSLTKELSQIHKNLNRETFPRMQRKTWIVLFDRHHEVWPRKWSSINPGSHSCPHQEPDLFIKSRTGMTIISHPHLGMQDLTGAAWQPHHNSYFWRHQAPLQIFYLADHLSFVMYVKSCWCYPIPAAWQRFANTRRRRSRYLGLFSQHQTQKDKPQADATIFRLTTGFVLTCWHDLHCRALSTPHHLTTSASHTGS